MTPYLVFAEAVKANPDLSFRDAWFDFESWERTRGFRDDPSRTSRDAIDWIRGLYELTIALEGFDGPGKESCQYALEAAFVAFARLELGDELYQAVQRWREWRRHESEEGAVQ